MKPMIKKKCFESACTVAMKARNFTEAANTTMGVLDLL